jgi:hypothetical protein
MLGRRLGRARRRCGELCFFFVIIVLFVNKKGTHGERDGYSWFVRSFWAFSFH